MRYVNRVLLLLLVLGVGSWALLFSLANSGTLALDLVFAQLPAARTSALLLGAFIVGGLCGLVAGSGAIWRAMRSERAMRRITRDRTPPPAS